MGLFNLFKNPISILDGKSKIAEEMEIYPNIGYDFSRIKSYKYKPESDTCYLIEGNNLIKAKADLQKVNDIIKEYAKSDKAFAKFQIDINSARFSSENMRIGYDDFCCLFCNPTTPSGKPTKFPLKMRINPLSADESSRLMMSKCGKTVHGWIYYLADGSIGKVEIYCWQGGNGYFIKDNYTLKKK